MQDSQKSIFILVLAIILPSLGVLFGMYWFPDTLLGKSLFMACKIGILLLPVTWYCLVNKNRISWSLPKQGGFAINIGIGALICSGIYAAYWLLGDKLIDPDFVKEQLRGVGFQEPIDYLIPVVYWTVVNSLLEEYFWRWFIVTECEKVTTPKLAIFISAAGFVLHHVVAMALYFDWVTVILCGFGVFIGGLLWSISYVRYRSIWPAYVSHMMIDLIIFYIGYDIMFN